MPCMPDFISNVFFWFLKYYLALRGPYLSYQMLWRMKMPVFLIPLNPTANIGLRIMRSFTHPSWTLRIHIKSKTKNCACQIWPRIFIHISFLNLLSCTVTVSVLCVRRCVTFPMNIIYAAAPFTVPPTATNCTAHNPAGLFLRVCFLTRSNNRAVCIRSFGNPSDVKRSQIYPCQTFLCKFHTFIRVCKTKIELNTRGLNEED